MKFLIKKKMYNKNDHIFSFHNFLPTIILLLISFLNFLCGHFISNFFKFNLINYYLYSNYIDISIGNQEDQQYFFKFFTDSFFFTFSLEDLKSFSITSNFYRTIYRVPFLINGNYTIFIFKDSELFDHFNAQIEKPYFHPSYTSLHCFGSNYQTRLCQASNFCMFSHHPAFVFPFHWTFNDTFLLSGSRFAPYDLKDLRFSAKSIKLFSSYPNNATWFNSTSTLFTRCYIDIMIWHTLADVTIPLYITLTSFQNNFFNFDFDTDSQKIFKKYPNYGKITPNHHLFVWDTLPGLQRLYYAKFLSSYPIEKIPYQGTYCFSNITLGLFKSEKVINASRNVVRKYHIESLGVKGFRDYFLNASLAKINQGHLINYYNPSRKHPIIRIIIRRTNQEVRRIINIDAVFNATKEMCPYCDVQTIVIEKFKKEEQIRVIANVSLLIGVHGSGLSHLVWMLPSIPSNNTNNQKPLTTGIIEILPYKYVCRDWYERLAEGFNIHYSPLYTKNISQSRWQPGHNQSKVILCHTQNYSCVQGKCNDFLRDQSVIVDIEYYKQVLKYYTNNFNKERDL